MLEIRERFSEQLHRVNLLHLHDPRGSEVTSTSTLGATTILLVSRALDRRCE